MDDDTLPPALGELFPGGPGGRTLPVPLPPGRIALTDEGDGPPGLWLTDAPAPGDLWARAHAEHHRSGLWPLLLKALDAAPDEDFRPWESGELYLELISSPDLHDPAAVLATWWDKYGGDEMTAPHGQGWPGPAPAPAPQTDPDTAARDYAAGLTAGDPALRLGLVAAGRGADALATCGWTGPMNYTNDTGEIAAVVRDWEDRFGARVVGVGFAELFLSVAAPPTTREEALHVAAEHHALCPDNIWQGPGSLATYAERLIGARSWQFWWD